MLHLTTFCEFCILLTTEVVLSYKIFQNLNVAAHLVVPAGWGPCLLRLLADNTIFVRNYRKWLKIWNLPNLGCNNKILHHLSLFKELQPLLTCW